MLKEQLEQKVNQDLVEINNQILSCIMKLNDLCRSVVHNDLNDDLRVVTHNAALMLDETKEYIQSYL